MRTKLSVCNGSILIALIFISILAANCLAKPIKRGDLVKIISSKDSSEIIGVLEHKDSKLIGVYNQYKGIRFFDTGEVLQAYICRRPRKGAVKTGALIGILLGGAIAYYFEWPRKTMHEDNPRTLHDESWEQKGYHETNLWVILAGIVGGGLLGAGIGCAFGDYVEVKTDDLFGHDPGTGIVNTGKPAESIILSVKLKL